MRLEDESELSWPQFFINVDNNFARGFTIILHLPTKSQNVTNEKMRHLVETHCQYRSVRNGSFCL